MPSLKLPIIVDVSCLETHLETATDYTLYLHSFRIHELEFTQKQTISKDGIFSPIPQMLRC